MEGPVLTNLRMLVCERSEIVAHDKQMKKPLVQLFELADRSRNDGKAPVWRFLGREIVQNRDLEIDSRPGGNKSGLDDILKQLRNRFGKFGGGAGGVFTVLMAVVLAWLLLSSYVIVDARQGYA